MRDVKKWESSLRGRKPDQTIDETGLKEFILHHNFLGYQFLKSLSNRLKNDSYLRLLDLRNNSMDHENLVEFMDYLKHNKSVMALDLRYNPGFTDDI